MPFLVCCLWHGKGNRYLHKHCWDLIPSVEDVGGRRVGPGRGWERLRDLRAAAMRRQRGLRGQPGRVGGDHAGCHDHGRVGRPARPVRSAALLQAESHVQLASLLPQRRQWHPLQCSCLACKIHERRSLVGCSPWGCQESDTTERLHFLFHALEKEMATHSSVLAWRTPGTAEPGGLPSMGSHRVGHDWSDLAAAAVLYPEQDAQIYMVFILFLVFLLACRWCAG